MVVSSNVTRYSKPVNFDYSKYLFEEGLNQEEKSQMHSTIEVSNYVTILPEYNWGRDDCRAWVTEDIVCGIHNPEVNRIGKCSAYTITGELSNGSQVEFLLSYWTIVGVKIAETQFTTDVKHSNFTQRHINKWLNWKMKSETVYQSALTTLFETGNECAFHEVRYRWSFSVNIPGYMPMNECYLYESLYWAQQAMLDEKNAYREAGFIVTGSKEWGYEIRRHDSDFTSFVIEPFVVMFEDWIHSPEWLENEDMQDEWLEVMNVMDFG